MLTKGLFAEVVRGCGRCLQSKSFEMDSLCIDCCWKEVCEELSAIIAEAAACMAEASSA